MSTPLDDAATPFDSDASATEIRPLSAAPLWSTRLKDRFGLSLGPDLVDWFDNELWRRNGPGEFAHPVSPESLLGVAPDSVWPPLMPPNFLPLVGSASGDWICLRLLDGEAHDSDAAYDLCHWFHGGGDWMPWGKTLAEALLFDHILPHLPASEQRHAVPSSLDANSFSSTGHHAWFEWMSRWIPTAIWQTVRAEAWNVDRAGWLNTLQHHRVCEVAIGCQLVIDALANDLKDHVDPAKANRMEMTWNDIMRWCFDLTQLSDDVKQRLHRDGGVPESAMNPLQQDWALVQRICEQIHAVVPELAWAAELLGYCHQRNGDTDNARTLFTSALRCSLFTDQSVRLRTHWATSGGDGMAKFSARWIREEDFESVGSKAEIKGANVTPPRANSIPYSVSIRDYVRCLGNRDGETIRSRVTSFFLEEANQNAVQGRRGETVRCLYAAGWDLGAEPMTRYAGLLDQLIDATQRAGWHSHEQFARMHRTCFRNRYGS